MMQTSSATKVATETEMDRTQTCCLAGTVTTSSNTTAYSSDGSCSGSTEGSSRKHDDGAGGVHAMMTLIDSLRQSTCDEQEDSFLAGSALPVPQNLEVLVVPEAEDCGTTVSSITMRLPQSSLYPQGSDTNLDALSVEPLRILQSPVPGNLRSREEAQDKEEEDAVHPTERNEMHGADSLTHREVVSPDTLGTLQERVAAKNAQEEAVNSASATPSFLPDQKEMKKPLPAGKAPPIAKLDATPSSPFYGPCQSKKIGSTATNEPDNDYHDRDHHNMMPDPREKIKTNGRGRANQSQSHGAFLNDLGTSELHTVQDLPQVAGMPPSPPRESVPGAFPVGMTASRGNPQHQPNNTQPTTYEAEEEATAPPPQQQGAAEEDTNLLEAKPVNEDNDALVSSRLDIPTATPDDEDGRRFPKRRSASSKSISVGLLVLLVVIVAAVVVPTTIVLVKKENNNADNHPDKIPGVAEDESLSHAELVERLDMLLPEDALKEARRTNSTPQALAYQWMLHDPLLSILSSSRIKQRFALTTLYYATDGDNWYNNTHWLDYNVHECFWHSADGHKKSDNQMDGYVPINPVHSNPCELPYTSPTNSIISQAPEEANNNDEYKHLWLRSNGLNGYIPSEVFWGLPALHSLSLRLNTLTSTIPTEIGLLTDLKAITLGGSEALTGTLPTEVGALTNLISLVVWGNRLSGKLPTQLGQLNSLFELLVDSNSFSGELPAQLGQLFGLHWLYVHYNRFTGTFPEWLFDLPMLEELALRGNDLTGTLPTEVGLMSSIELLYLDENAFTGLVPTQLGLLTDTLFQFFLGHNYLSGQVPSELGLLVDAGTISFFVNDLTGTIPTELGRLSTAFQLDLSNCLVAGTIPTELGLLPSNWSGIPTDVALLSPMSLYLENNQLSGLIPSELGQREELSILLLQGNNLSGAIPTQLGLLANLTFFNVSANPLLSGEVPDSLCEFHFDGFECSDTLFGCGCPDIIYNASSSNESVYNANISTYY